MSPLTSVCDSLKTALAFTVSVSRSLPLQDRGWKGIINSLSLSAALVLQTERLNLPEKCYPETPAFLHQSGCFLPQGHGFCLPQVLVQAIKEAKEQHPDMSVTKVVVHQETEISEE